MSQLQTLAAGIRLTITNPQSDSSSAFGPGVAALCQGVRDHGSLNASAKHMRMAYSKAWRIIRDTEASLGVQLLLRDGAHGSTLTEDGTRLLDAYVAIQEALSEQAQKLFNELVS